MSIDRLSNMLSALKNASMAKNTYVEIMHTSLCSDVAKVLKNTGFLSEVKTFKQQHSSIKMLHLDLAKKDGLINLTDAKRVSKPGRRVYRSASDIYLVANGYGVCVVSTPRGVMDGRDAKKKKLGGEVLCEVR